MSSGSSYSDYSSDNEEPLENNNNKQQLKPQRQPARSPKRTIPPKRKLRSNRSPAPQSQVPKKDTKDTPKEWYFYLSLCVYIAVIANWLFMNANYLQYSLLWMKPFMIVCFSLALCHAFLAKFTGPGLLPWNWSETKSHSYSKEEIQEGKATTQQQLQFAQENPKPPRAVFSPSYGYIVLRGDHYCTLLGCWIGLKNHRYFYDFLVFSSLTIFTSFTTSMVLIFQNYEPDWPVPFFVCAMLTCWYSCALLGQLFRQTVNLAQNRTEVEKKLHLPNKYCKPLIQNFEEVFGDIKFCLLWLLPIPIPPQSDGFSYDVVHDENEPILAAKATQPIL